jgi:hemin uptake protein HemP
MSKSADVHDSGGEEFGPARGVKRVKSSDVFGGASELIITHNDQEYRLRITSANKLILTK